MSVSVQPTESFGMSSPSAVSPVSDTAQKDAVEPQQTLSDSLAPHKNVSRRKVVNHMMSGSQTVIVDHLRDGHIVDRHSMLTVEGRMPKEIDQAYQQIISTFWHDLIQ